MDVLERWDQAPELQIKVAQVEMPFVKNVLHKFKVNANLHHMTRR